MRSFFILIGVFLGVSLSGRAYAESPSVGADRMTACEAYNSCVRSCYQPSYRVYDSEGPRACSGDAEILGWLLGELPGTLVSMTLPPVAIGGRAKWLFELARNHGVSAVINGVFRRDAPVTDCSRCVDSCVGDLVACHNQPVRDGSACGTVSPATAGAARLDGGNPPAHPASVTQNRRCAGLGSVCCENNALLPSPFRGPTAFCYEPRVASGLVCAPPPPARTSSAASSSGSTETAAAPHNYPAQSQDPNRDGGDVHF